jgi:hypothetical protein
MEGFGKATFKITPRPVTQNRVEKGKERVEENVPMN